MKVFKKIIDAIKWRIIIYIDRKHPEACWCNLVMWYNGGYTLREMFGSEESRWNTHSCNGAGYCGKCNKTGRLEEKRMRDIENTRSEIIKAVKDVIDIFRRGVT